MRVRAIVYTTFYIIFYARSDIHDLRFAVKSAIFKSVVLFFLGGGGTNESNANSPQRFIDTSPDDD